MVYTARKPCLAGTTYLGRKYSKLKFVSLCHGFTDVYHIAETLGFKRENITFEAPGVNHFIWLTRFHHKGEDAFPILNEWIEKEAPKYWERCQPSDDLGPKAVDLYKRFRAFPIGDTCTPWWYHVDDETERRWKENPRKWWSFVLEPPKEDPVESLFKVAEKPSIKVTSVFPPEKSGEIIVPLIEFIACDIPRVFIVNIMNTGNFVSGIPENFEVEVPALVSKRGFRELEPMDCQSR